MSRSGSSDPHDKGVSVPNEKKIRAGNAFGIETDWQIGSHELLATSIARAYAAYS